MDKLLKGVRTVLYGFSVAAMSVMLIVIFAQVVTRYSFGYTPEWSEELARFLFVWVVFLGSALEEEGQVKNGHLGLKLAQVGGAGQDHVDGAVNEAFGHVLLAAELRGREDLDFHVSAGFFSDQLGEIVGTLGVGVAHFGDVAEFEHGFGESGHAEGNGHENDCTHEETFHDSSCNGS